MVHNNVHCFGCLSLMIHKHIYKGKRSQPKQKYVRLRALVCSFHMCNERVEVCVHVPFAFSLKSFYGNWTLVMCFFVCANDINVNYHILTLNTYLQRSHIKPIEITVNAQNEMEKKKTLKQSKQNLTLCMITENKMSFNAIFMQFHSKI